MPTHASKIAPHLKRESLGAKDGCPSVDQGAARHVYEQQVATQQEAEAGPNRDSNQQEARLEVLPTEDRPVPPVDNRQAKLQMPVVPVQDPRAPLQELPAVEE